MNGRTWATSLRVRLPITNSEKQLGSPTTNWQVYRDSKLMAPVLLRHDIALKAVKPLSLAMAGSSLPPRMGRSEQRGKKWHRTKTNGENLPERWHPPQTRPNGQWKLKNSFALHSNLVMDNLRLTLRNRKLRPGDSKYLEGGHVSLSRAWSQSPRLLYYAKVTHRKVS